MKPELRKSQLRVEFEGGEIGSLRIMAWALKRLTRSARIKSMAETVAVQATVAFDHAHLQRREMDTDGNVLYPGSLAVAHLLLTDDPARDALSVICWYMEHGQALEKHELHTTDIIQAEMSSLYLSTRAFADEYPGVVTENWPPL